MTRNTDEQLRELFTALRAETQAQTPAPPFDAMISEAKRAAAAREQLRLVPGGRRGARYRLVRWGGWTSAAVAAALVGLMLIGNDPPTDEAFEQLVTAYSTDASGGAWVSPTADLLEVPGLELLRDMPGLGVSTRGQPGNPALGRDPDEREEL